MGKKTTLCMLFTAVLCCFSDSGAEKITVGEGTNAAYAHPEKESGRQPGVIHAERRKDFTDVFSTDIDQFFGDLRVTMKRLVSDCRAQPSRADSIAIAYLDTLDAYGDRFYDLWYSADTALANDSALVSLYIDRLRENGVQSVYMPYGWIFKPDPNHILSMAAQFLSESAKRFFITRAQDQIQSCLYDDAVIMLDGDTYAQRLKLWDSFYHIYKGSYAAGVARAYMKRYASMYLSCYSQADNLFADCNGSDLTRKLPRFVDDGDTGWSASRIARWYSIEEAGPIRSARRDSLMQAMGLTPLLGVTRDDLPSSIMMPGDFHGSELSLDAGESRWLALTGSRGEWELQDCEPKMTKCYDPINDDGLDDTTGVCVRVDLQQVAYLLSDESLTPGPVFAGFAADRPTLPEPNGSRVIDNLDKPYRLVSVSSLSQSQGNAYEYEVIFLEYNGRSQFLFRPFRGGETNAALLWVGDLDGDLKPDVILDASNHYNLSDIRVFLSGGAKAGEMMRMVARLRTSGD